MGIIEAARNFARSETEQYGTPILVHLEISEKKAIELAEQLGADKKIVQVGTNLMDVKLGQAIKENKREHHIEMSAEATRDFLNNFELSDKERQKIINCVEAHHGTVPFKSREAEICANADCYRFIHPKGFFAFLLLLGKRGGSFAECLARAEEKMEEKHNTLSLDICKKELEHYYIALKQFIKDARSF
ncbi:MAG: hypothetical protein KKA90_05165 [Nanoarchaeota archaeon]|nr:hypothetical protein [Nanoarchaeota archaeon]